MSIESEEVLKSSIDENADIEDIPSSKSIEVEAQILKPSLNKTDALEDIRLLKSLPKFLEDDDFDFEERFKIEEIKYWETLGQEAWEANTRGRLALLSKWILLQAKSKFVNADEEERQHMMIENSNRKLWDNTIVMRRRESIQWIAEARSSRAIDLHNRLKAKQRTSTTDKLQDSHVKHGVKKKV